MGEGELAHLRRRRLDQFLVAVAKRRAPQPRHGFDVRLAVGVVDIDALAALDDERPGVAKAGQIGVGMHQGLDIAGGEIAERHDNPLTDPEGYAAIVARWCPSRQRRDLCTNWIAVRLL